MVVGRPLHFAYAACTVSPANTPVNPQLAVPVQNQIPNRKLCARLTTNPHFASPLPSPMQRMDTSGRMVLGSGGGQEQAKQMFGKVWRGGRIMGTIVGCYACAMKAAGQADVWQGVEGGTVQLLSLTGLCSLALHSGAALLPLKRFFPQEEMAAILRFGAEDLFKDNPTHSTKTTKAAHCTSAGGDGGHPALRRRRSVQGRCCSGGGARPGGGGGRFGRHSGARRGESVHPSVAGAALLDGMRCPVVFYCWLRCAAGKTVAEVDLDAILERAESTPEIQTGLAAAEWPVPGWCETTPNSHSFPTRPFHS